jgi:hypothetical protein
MIVAAPDPRVSICIPAFNRPLELMDAVQSVLAQDYGDFEVVISDDSGNLGDAVDSIADSRLRYFRNPHRLGMAANWDCAVNHSRGKLIGLLMDDDRLLPGYLSAVVAAFDADPLVDVVFTDHLYDDAGSLAPRSCRLGAGRWEGFLIAYLEHMPVPISATMMKRAVWAAVTPLPDLWAADVVAHLRAILAGCVFCYLPEPLMVYRRHAGQLSKIGERMAADTVAAWQLFGFSPGSREEKLRRNHIAQATKRLGAAHLRAGDLREGRNALLRAMRLAPGSTRARDLLSVIISIHPAVTRTAYNLADRARDAR